VKFGFYPSKLKKQRFFANDFKIQGVAKAPPSDAHACDKDHESETSTYDFASQECKQICFVLPNPVKDALVWSYKGSLLQLLRRSAWQRLSVRTEFQTSLRSIWRWSASRESVYQPMYSLSKDVRLEKWRRWKRSTWSRQFELFQAVVLFTVKPPLSNFFCFKPLTCSFKSKCIYWWLYWSNFPPCEGVRSCSPLWRRKVISVATYPHTKAPSLHHSLSTTYQVNCFSCYLSALHLPFEIFWALCDDLQHIWSTALLNFEALD